MLSFEVCNAARLRRDSRYDGGFFTAVRTTRIYCRPVCPVKQPLTRNVTYYQSAAAAEAAGYRPCLRCRPETAPFCPAWNGTRSTVARALKLIDAGALDHDSVATLAERLGITSRHLARLFERHVGASPQQVATTRRVQRAKRLLDTTDDTMTEIAYRAGFSSLRRFNAAFMAARHQAFAQPRAGNAQSGVLTRFSRPNRRCRCRSRHPRQCARRIRHARRRRYRTRSRLASSGRRCGCPRRRSGSIVPCRSPA
jgi:AraC family transcriptional regulator, regulatory protein of adaptative response / methylated-DNA-[protein]-cysteine methyltransferase